MAYIVMAYIVLAYIVMAYTVTVHIVMAYTVVADIVMAFYSPYSYGPSGPGRASSAHST